MKLETSLTVMALGWMGAGVIAYLYGSTADATYCMAFSAAIGANR